MSDHVLSPYMELARYFNCQELEELCTKAMLVQTTVGMIMSCRQSDMQVPFQVFTNSIFDVDTSTRCLNYVSECGDIFDFVN